MKIKIEEQSKEIREEQLINLKILKVVAKQGQCSLLVVSRMNINKKSLVSTLYINRLNDKEQVRIMAPKVLIVLAL